MKNLIFFIGVISMMVLFGCDTQKSLTAQNSKEIMKNKEAINAFDNKALTVNGGARPTAVLTPLMAPGYKSSGSIPSKAKNAEQLIGQLEFFWKLIPDLKWEPQEIMNDGDTYIVRSRATGSPNGDFMGMPTDGSKSFDIMTIDIHKMKDGKFLSTHHVEDWAVGMGQLKGPKQKSAMDLANEFMGAMGKGDMAAMDNLMHEDMVWQNAGDKAMPWIGPWNGKKAIMENYFPNFMKGFETIKWEPVDGLTNGDTAAFFGQMIGKLKPSGQTTDEFTYALRVKTKDGKIILWNWFEDSLEVSKAFNGKK